MKEAKSRAPHVVLFTSPGLGHFIPFCELAYRLSVDFHCKVTFIVFDSFYSSPHSSPYLDKLSEAAPDVDLVQIPQPQIPGDNMATTQRLKMTIAESREHIEQILQSALPVSAFIVDVFCMMMKDIASKLGIPTYMFYTSSAAMVVIVLSAPVLASQISASFKDVEFGIQLPGLPPIQGKDMPQALLDRSDPVFYGFVGFHKLLENTQGIIVNTFQGLEDGALNALQQYWKHEIFAVGPLISPFLREENEGSRCTEWLNAQPECSVIFVSFGSSVTFSKKQLIEIGEGLERSQQRFVWVVRKKTSNDESASNDTYFSIPHTQVDELLPRELLDRTRDRGLVVPSWAPQFNILSHPSVGGSISHCGWNSIMESIYCGVPLIPWPMCAEQKVNRVLVLEEFAIGVDLKRERDGFAKRDEIERSVREMMEGKQGMRARDKAREMKIQALEALRNSESSWKDAGAFVHKIAKEDDGAFVHKIAKEDEEDILIV